MGSVSYGMMLAYLTLLMNVFHIAVCTIVAFVTICIFTIGLGWIEDAGKARSEQLKQSRFIARALPVTPSPLTAAGPLSLV